MLKSRNLTKFDSDHPTLLLVFTLLQPQPNSERRSSWWIYACLKYWFFDPDFIPHKSKIGRSNYLKIIKNSILISKDILSNEKLKYLIILMRKYLCIARNMQKVYTLHPPPIRQGVCSKLISNVGLPDDGWHRSCFCLLLCLLGTEAKKKRKLIAGVFRIGMTRKTSRSKFETIWDVYLLLYESRVILEFFSISMVNSTRMKYLTGWSVCMLSLWNYHTL